LIFLPPSPDKNQPKKWRCQPGRRHRVPECRTHSCAAVRRAPLRGSRTKRRHEESANDSFFAF